MLQARGGGMDWSVSIIAPVPHTGGYDVKARGTGPGTSSELGNHWFPSLIKPMTPLTGPGISSCNQQVVLDQISPVPEPSSGFQLTPRKSPRPCTVLSPPPH